MHKQIDKSKGPGVYIPPPLIYVLFFLAAIFLQRKIPFAAVFFHLFIMKIVGIALVVLSVYFLTRSLRQFFLTKNTVVLIKPASTLQTTGVYALTRNPMYLGLTLLYLAITCFIGNWWNLILFPFLVLVIQELVIKPEERYLQIEFGEEYKAYLKKTRRWI